MTGTDWGQMTPPEWIEGEVEHEDDAGDRARAWWIRTDDGPMVRIAARAGGASPSFAIADFPLEAARRLAAQIEAAIAAAEASEA